MSYICYYGRIERWDIVLQIAKQYPSCIWGIEQVHRMIHYLIQYTKNVFLPFLVYPIYTDRPDILKLLKIIYQNYQFQKPSKNSNS